MNNSGQGLDAKSVTDLWKSGNLTDIECINELIDLLEGGIRELEQRLNEQ